MIKKLFGLLKDAGIDVYLPGKKQGKATDAYAVINCTGSEPGKTGSELYTFFSVALLAPDESYMALCDLEAKTVAALKGSCFKFTESRNEDSFSEAGAYKRVLLYRVLSRNCTNL